MSQREPIREQGTKEPYKVRRDENSGNQTDRAPMASESRKHGNPQCVAGRQARLVNYTYHAYNSTRFQSNRRSELKKTRVCSWGVVDVEFQEIFEIKVNGP